MEDSASSVPSIWASLNSWFTPTVFFVLLNLMIATIVFTSNLPNNNQQNHNRHGEEEKQNSQNEQHQNDRNQPQIARSPSILQSFKSFNFYPHRSQQEFSSEIHHQQEALEVAATQYVFNQPLHHEHFDFDPTRSDQVAAAADAQFAAFNQTHEVGLPNTETHFVWEQQQAVKTATNHFDFDPTRQEIPEDTGLEDTHEEQTEEFQSLDDVYSMLKGGHVSRSKSDKLPASGEVPPKLPAKSKSAFSHFEEEKIVEARRPATVRERESAARAIEEDDVEVDAKADDFINKFKNDLKKQRTESINRTKGAPSKGTAK